ncbi:hypothetical protein COO59_08830 [Mixta theicola]|uniref:Uncharacterized protein n=1 Tax=Mixta theicola TaxID=1458355 RepID=A0A2K1QAM2_9GAMM|nr:hypothetical protein COO59_08830 [Mixta theicola]
MLSALYPSYFRRQVRWFSPLTPVTYCDKLPGIHGVAACLQLELFRVFMRQRRISRSDNRHHERNAT